MIVVAGATGSLGGKTVHGLLERGESVRVLVRPTSTYGPLRALGAEIALGDLKDPGSLERACNGAETVITTAPASKRGDDAIENVDLQGNRNLIAAARAAGVGRFIFVSTLGAAADSPVPLFRAKAAAEQYLRDSGMVHTILQPNILMDVWFPMLVEGPALAGRPVTLVGDSVHRHAFVAEQDVAAFAVAAVRSPAARNATIVIGGPEALTFRDVVRAYGEAAGRIFPVRSVAPGEPLPGVPEVAWGIAALLETTDSVIPMDDTARRFGVRLTTALEFARSRTAQAAADRP